MGNNQRHLMQAAAGYSVRQCVTGVVLKYLVIPKNRVFCPEIKSKSNFPNPPEPCSQSFVARIICHSSACGYWAKRGIKRKARLSGFSQIDGFYSSINGGEESTATASRSSKS